MKDKLKATMIYDNKFDSPLIVSSPHSGNYYPNIYLDKIDVDFDICKSIEDMYVDSLIQNLVKLNITTHIATISRAVIDLNRESNELDPDKFNGEIIFDVNNSSYVKSGIGLMPINTPRGEIKFKEKFEVKELTFLIDNFYKPWHQKMEEIINDKLKKFGRVFLLDCHSMPSRNFEDAKDLKLPDFILGDCFGKTCNIKYIDIIEQFLRDKNFSVARNVPYSGGYITKHYNNRSKGIQTLQIEIRRDLYMNELSYQKKDNFKLIRDVYTELIGLVNENIIEESDLTNKIAAQ